MSIAPGGKKPAQVDRGWTLQFELPWCFVCRLYKEEHVHQTSEGPKRLDSGYWRPEGIPSQDGPVENDGVTLHDPDSDLFTVGARPGDTPRQVRVAFRKLARKTHPDVGGSPERMRAVLEAYTRLQKGGRAL